MNVLTIIFTPFIFCTLLLSTKCVPAQKKFNCVTGAKLYEVIPGEAVRDSAVFNLLSAYKDSMATRMNEVVTEIKVPLSKTQPESTLGNWISDAVKNNVSRQSKKVDICLFSYGCMGKEYLAPGPLRRKDFYELIPFENKMVLLSVSGRMLTHLCDSIARTNGLPVSGLSFTIDSGKARAIMVNKHPLNDHLVYTLLVNDYILSRYNQLLGTILYRHTGLYLRDILIEESVLQQQKGVPVRATLEKRITYAE